LVNAADYGVPQRRVRLFMFGFRSGDAPPFPLPTHAKIPDLQGQPIKPWVTLGEALSVLPPLAAEEVQRPTAKMAVELKGVKPGSGVKSPGKSEVTRPGGHWGYKQGAFVADLTQSARTVTANAQQDWIRDPKLGLRRLCPRECAAIQGFPQAWVFQGTRSTQYRLVGNAVPPPLSQALGMALRRHIRMESGDVDADLSNLLPLPPPLRLAIEYTVRDERANGESRRASPNRRVSRIVGSEAARG
jgi:DNA (cytosine-5)-methyltransferase 1